MSIFLSTITPGESVALHMCNILIFGSNLSQHGVDYVLLHLFTGAVFAIVVSAL